MCGAEARRAVAGASVAGKGSGERGGRGMARRNRAATEPQAQNPTRTKSLPRSSLLPLSLMTTRSSRLRRIMSRGRSMVLDAIFAQKNGPHKGFALNLEPGTEPKIAKPQTS